MYSIPGYTHEHNCRTYQTGGGVSLYIEDNMYTHCTKRLELNVSSPVIESMFIELDASYLGKKCIIGNIYKPPIAISLNFSRFLLQY